MTQGQAYVLAHQIKAQVAYLLRTIVKAHADRTITPVESYQLGVQALAMASNAAMALGDMDGETQQAILTLWEQGELNMPGESARE
jgi:hypothetical protein